MKTSNTGTHESKSGMGQKHEDIMDAVKGEGPWQRKILLVIIVCSFSLATHNLAMSFFAPNLDHWCARPADSNLSVEEWKEIALPPNDRHCSRYAFDTVSHLQEGHLDNSTAREIVACDSWEYDDSLYVSTVLSEWNLVCEREWFISMSKSVFIGGYFCSVMFFGYLADRLGRRPIIAICNLIAVISAITSCFSTSFLMFAVCRFFIAAGIAGAYNTAFVLLMEVIGPKMRSLYGIGVNIGWITGYVSLPLIAWLLRDWFWIQVVITSPCILFLSCWWLLPESPRWLLTHGKQDAAMEILSKAGKANGVVLVDVESELKAIISKTSKAHETENANASVLLLLKPGLWQKTLIILYIWCMIAFMYYGISFNTNEFPGDPFVNFAAYGLIEIPANIISLYFMRSKGRRNPLAISLAAAGASCLLMYPAPDDIWWIGVMLSLFGKFCIACSFSIVYVYTAEIFPTVVRNVGLGSASVSGRVGSIIAPFVRELGKATHPVVPQIVFGILAVTGAILTLLLPETNNLTIPDTLEEAAGITR